MEADITGRTFGRLTAIAREDGSRWRFKRACGAQNFLVSRSVRYRETLSCAGESGKITAPSHVRSGLWSSHEARGPATIAQTTEQGRSRLRCDRGAASSSEIGCRGIVSRGNFPAHSGIFAQPHIPCPIRLSLPRAARGRRCGSWRRRPEDQGVCRRGKDFDATAHCRSSRR